MRVGVIGLGKMGLLHAGIINSVQDANVTAVCEKELFFGTAAKALLPKRISIYRDYQEMVAEEQLDAVFVTTPISTHASIVSDLIKSSMDLSIFVEKPLAASHEQARATCDAAGRSHGVHTVGFQKRFSPVFGKARDFIEQKIIGEPILFKAYCFSSDVLRRGSAWRFENNSGGVLLDLAPHLLDLLIWFFGEPNVIFAIKKRVYSSEVDDYVHAVMSYESGLHGSMDACWSISNFRLPEILVEIYGKNGMLAVTDDYVSFRPGKETGQIGGGRIFYRQSFNTKVPFLLTDPEYTLEDAAFVDAVRNRRMPELSFVQATRVNAVIDKILQQCR